MKIELNKLTVEELRELNQQVVLEIRHRQNQLARTFQEGQIVSWVNHRDGKRIHGTVIKINSKTIKVRTEMGMWSVSPSLLTLVTFDNSEALGVPPQR